jgi:MFS transporter, Spinster family, sphingosine-1-phosphate transporter
MVPISTDTQPKDVRSHPAIALGVLTAINALNYLDRFLVAPLLPLIIAGLTLDDRQAGSLQSAFILVYALVSPLAGWLGDRASRLRVAALGVALWSLATAGSGLAATFTWLLLFRALVGIGEATYTVVTPSLLSDHYPSSRRGEVLSIFYAAMPLGIALAYVLGGQIGARYGWRPAFFLAGIPGLLCAGLLLVLREPPRGRCDVGQDATVKLPLLDFLRVLRQRPSYFLNMGAQTIYTFTMGGLGAWMPTYFVRERGLSVARAGTIFGVLLLAAGALGTLLGGVIGDELARKNRSGHFVFSGLTMLAAVPFTLAAVLAPQPLIYWPAMGMSLFCLFLNNGPLNAALVNVLPTTARARGMGIHVTVIHLLGDAISPFLIGLASHAIGLRWPVLVTGLFASVAGLLLLAGRSQLARDLDAANRA